MVPDIVPLSLIGTSLCISVLSLVTGTSLCITVLSPVIGTSPSSLSYLPGNWYVTLHHFRISLAVGTSLCITVLSLLQLVPHFVSLSYLSCNWYLILYHCLISLAIDTSFCITVLSLLQLVPHFVSLSYLWSSYKCRWWHCSQTTEAAECLVLQCVEMVSPTQYNSCVDQDLCAVPLSISQMKRYTSQYSLSVSPVK